MAEDDSRPIAPKARHGSRLASSSSAIEKLAEARFLIDEEAANSADAIAFVHAVLCQIGLPRSPRKERVWMRSNGNASLRVQAGALLAAGETWIEQPLPQGPYARLILADISTHSVRHRSRHVPMEDSVTAYMRKRLKLLVTGGVRGTCTSFKREAQALATAQMALGVHYAEGGRQKAVQHNAALVEEFAAWTDHKELHDDRWPKELVLNESFYKSLQAHAAPIDMRAYRALAHSALAQDIYTWLAHRLPRLKAPLGLPWAVLAEQFGGYSDVKEFRKEFIKRMREVATVYPDAQLEVVRGRREAMGGSLLLKPSRAPVHPIATVVVAAIEAPMAGEAEDRSEIRRLLREDLVGPSDGSRA